MWCQQISCVLSSNVLKAKLPGGVHRLPCPGGCACRCFHRTRLRPRRFPGRPCDTPWEGRTCGRLADRHSEGSMQTLLGWTNLGLSSCGCVTWLHVFSLVSNCQASPGTTRDRTLHFHPFPQLWRGRLFWTVTLTQSKLIRNSFNVYTGKARINNPRFTVPELVGDEKTA